MVLFKKNGFALFWLIAVADLALIFFEQEQYRNYSKPLLVPTLLLTLLARTGFKRLKFSKALIVFALLLAAIGDVMLLNGQHTNYFYLGLIAFMGTHFLYTLYFLTIQPILAKNITTILVGGLIAAGISFTGLYLLKPFIGELQTPVTVYTIFLSLMFITAVNVIHYKNSKQLAIETFIPGAVLFILSYFILAANMFYIKEQFVGIAVMATYCGAQYYMVRGFINQLGKVRSNTRKASKRSIRIQQTKDQFLIE